MLTVVDGQAIVDGESQAEKVDQDPESVEDVMPVWTLEEKMPAR